MPRKPIIDYKRYFEFRGGFAYCTVLGCARPDWGYSLTGSNTTSMLKHMRDKHPTEYKEGVVMQAAVLAEADTASAVIVPIYAASAKYETFDSMTGEDAPDDFTFHACSTMAEAAELSAGKRYRIKLEAARPDANTRGQKAVLENVAVPSTQAAGQESFADASRACNKCATLQAQLEKTAAEKEQLRKVNDQLKKGTDQMRAFIKQRGLSDAFIEFMLTPSA